MPIAVSAWSETTAGERGAPMTLDFLTERVIARELIRAHVYETAAEHNARLPRRADGAEPGATERALNGEHRGPHAPLDWRARYARAAAAFERNGFLLLADGRQLCDLEETAELRAGSEVVFLKLVPLVGG